MIKEGQAGAGSQLQRLSARYIEKGGERGNNDGFMIDYPEYIIDVVESAATRAGKEYDLKSLRWLNPTETTTAVPDHTYVMQIDGVRSADDAVLIISNENYPNVVAAAAAQIGAIDERLSPETRKRILKPLLVDQYGKQSFALYPVLEPFATNKLIGKLQKQLLQDDICRWLANLAKETKKACNEAEERNARFSKPFQFLTEQEALPSDVKTASGAFGKSAEMGTHEIFNVVQHGDFWLGNIMLDRGTLPYTGILSRNFHVIDWGGSNLDGYPFGDLVRFIMSTRRHSFAPADLIEAYAEISDVPANDIAFYCLAEMGALGLNLDNFPYDRYIKLVTSTFGWLKQHGLA